MHLSKEGVLLFLLLCNLSRTFSASDDHDHGDDHTGHDHGGHEDHDGGDDHTGHDHDSEHNHGHDGHDHTGLPHGHGDIDQNCPKDDEHDNAMQESQGGDHDGHDHEGHGHDHEGHGHDHEGHGHDHEGHGHGHTHGDEDIHDHTAHGHVDWDGKEGACLATELHFDGKEAYYEILEKSPNLSDITVCTYLTTNSDGVAQGVITNIHSHLKNNHFIIFGGMENQKPFVRFIFEGQTRRFGTEFQPNTKVHMCMVSSVANNTVKVYINGQKQKKVLTYRNLGTIPKGGTVQFGRVKGDKYRMYNGTLRNFMLWGKRLTDEEIGKIYTHNYCPGEVIFLPMKEHTIPMKANVPTEACPKTAYKFDNSGDKVEYLELAHGLPKLEFFTVCVQVTTNALGIIPGTIASYGTKEQPEMISFGGEIGKNGKAYTRFVVAGRVRLMDLKFNSSTSYRLCMAYNLAHKHLTTHVNDQMSIMTTFETISELPGGGMNIIGQRQRKLGGCFDRDRAYNGEIEDFMIWTRAFSQDDIEAYAAGKCPVDAFLTTKKEEVIPHGRFYKHESCPSIEYTLNNQGNVLEYLDILPIVDPFPEAEYLTVCLETTTDANGTIPGSLGGYSTKSQKKAITVSGKMGGSGPEIHITLNGDTEKAKATAAANTKYNFCVSFHTPHGHVLTYINGEFVHDFDFHGASPIPGGGKIIVGQDQGCPGGCFDRKEAYNGKIGNFMVWNRALSVEEMKAIADDNECPKGQMADLRAGNAVKVSSTIPE